MKLSSSEKSERVLRFLLGLRNPRIATALARYGFSQADLDDGWRLLAQLGSGKLPAIEGLPERSKVLAELQDWGRQWLPVASATLQHRFPHVADEFLMKAGDRRAPRVLVAVVDEIVTRLDAWFQNRGLYGREGEQALSVLESRGLNAETNSRARTLIASLKNAGSEPEWLLAQKEAQAHADATLWCWYLEWSRIARVAIKERALLRQLGFKANDAGEHDGGGSGDPDP